MFAGTVEMSFDESEIWEIFCLPHRLISCSVYVKIDFIYFMFCILAIFLKLNQVEVRI